MNERKCFVLRKSFIMTKNKHLFSVHIRSIRGVSINVNVCRRRLRILSINSKRANMVDNKCS